MLPPLAPTQHIAPARTHLSGSTVHWATLSLLVAWDVVLRLHCLASKPFWFDETFSVEMARLTWRNFARVLWWREANMSLYYLLLRGWLHFGTSETFIRSLSVVIAAAEVPALYWLARQLYDKRIALLSAALLSVNAFDIRYSQETRSYSLFFLLATLSSACLVHLLHDPTPRNRIAYVVSTSLAAYAHFYALLLVLVQSTVLRSAAIPVPPSEQESVRKQLNSSYKTVALAVLPLLMFVAKTGAGPIRWVTRPGVGDLFAFFEHLSGGAHWPMAALFAAAIVAAILPVRAYLWKRGQPWETWRAQFLLVWLAGPILLTAALSFARPVFLDRFLIFCLPPLLILVAAGLARLRNAPMIGVALSGLLLLSLPGVFYVYGHDFDSQRDASGAATAFILDHSQPGDGIVFNIPATRIAYEFFRSLRAGVNTAGPDFDGQMGPEIVFPHHSQGLDYRDFTGKPATELLSQAGSEHKRVWVMLMNNWRNGDVDEATKTLTKVLPESLPKVSRWQFPKVEVRLYSKE